MLASERLIEIESAFATRVRAIIPLELDGETLRLIMHLHDGTNLRVAEQWRGRELERYSYYWLTAGNELKIGWDNAPHHQQLENYPHHKHIATKNSLEPSAESCLEDVMAVILSATPQ